MTKILDILPSVPFDERNKLPNESGIYFVIDSQEIVQYIGRSQNIHKRWEKHHRNSQLADMCGVNIAYLKISEVAFLPSIEKALIREFNPLLNNTKVSLKKKVRQQQAHADKERKLRNVPLSIRSSNSKDTDVQQIFKQQKNLRKEPLPPKNLPISPDKSLGELSQKDCELFMLPYYEKFNLQLSEKAYLELLDLWNCYEDMEFNCPKYSKELVASECIQQNRHENGEKWKFTNVGKLMLGSLSLMLFNQLQELKLLERLEQLEQAVIEAKRKSNLTILNSAIENLRIYRAQYKKVLGKTLCFLEIKVNKNEVYKIGVTVLDVELYIEETRRDLLKYFNKVEIKPLVVMENLGNVKFYFNYRYKDYNYKIGELTGYFDFGNEIKAVLRDLMEMKKKKLSKIEQGILTDDFAKVKRSLLTKAGMKDGKKAGRKKKQPLRNSHRPSRHCSGAKTRVIATEGC